MFATFSADGSAAGRGTKTQVSASAPRAKRNQVARACDYCRINRIRCDDQTPCQNCQNRGERCKFSKSKDSQSLAAANQEIERLGSKLKQLEDQIKEYRAREAEVRPPTPASIVPSSRVSVPSTSPAPSPRLISGEFPKTKKRWEGIYVASRRNGVDPSFHGPVSATYFTARLSEYLKQELPGSYDESRLQPNTAGNVFASPTSNIVADATALRYDELELAEAAAEDLPRSQEEAFLSLFWQSYNCITPVIDETEFQEHYSSLWMAQGGPSARQPSALVDIILAICIQYGVCFMFPREDDANNATDIGLDDSSVAGRGFFARCQRLLLYELERPSLRTLQCLLFSIVYLQNALFVNQADNLLAVAVRIAHTLGLANEPQNHLTPIQQNRQRRLWWTFYLLDTQIGIALGRPFFTHASTIACEVPRTGPAFRGDVIPCLSFEDGEISLEDFSTQSIKLAINVRVIHEAIEEKGSELIESLGCKNMYENPKIMESLAGLLSKATVNIQKWIENVPGPLRSTRGGDNEPFSARRSNLYIDLHQPPWLQRQRVQLNLLYHEFMMGLFRPFIRITPVAVSLTPLSDGHSISCLNHSMSITSICHQVLSETDILNGWHSAYRTQWNAALSILGFVIGNPVCPPTPSGRKALQQATSVFELLGNSFATATSAAEIVRDMIKLAQQLILRFRSTPNTSSSISRYSSQQHQQQEQQQQKQQKESLSLAVSQAQQHSITTAFQPTSQHNETYQAPTNSHSQPSSGIPVQRNLFSDLSSPLFVDPASSQDIARTMQWPSSMSMDLTPNTMLVPGEQFQWPDPMSHIQQEASQQSTNGGWHQ